MGKDLLHKLKQQESQSFALNGVKTLVNGKNSAPYKYIGLRADEDSEVTVTSDAEKGDLQITLNLSKSEVFVLPIKDINVISGKVQGYIK